MKKLEESTAMQELPEGWILARVGDVTRRIENVDPTQRPDETFHYIDIGSIDNKLQEIRRVKTFLGRNAPSRARRWVRAGDILVSTVRTYLRNIAIVPRELDGQLASTGFAVLRANEAVLGEYLFLWVLTAVFTKTLSSAQDGTLYPAVREGDVRRQVFPLAPLGEQRLIVERVKALENPLEKAAKHLGSALEELEVFRSGVLESAFDLTGLTKTLGEVAYGISAGKSLKCEERPPKSDEIGVVKVNAVTWGAFDSTASKTLPSGFSPPAKARIQSGDLLFSRANTRSLVGAVVLVEEDPGNLYLSDKILRIEADREDKSWLLWFLRSALGRRQLESMASGNQASMKNITQANLRKVVIPYPTSQERGRIIASIEEKMASASCVGSVIRRVRKDIGIITEQMLVAAFQGKLTTRLPGASPADVALKKALEENEQQASPRVRRRGSTPMAKDVGITANLEGWPEGGFTFEELRTVTGLDYRQLKEELFALLGSSPRVLFQEFHEDEEVMRIKKVLS